MMVKSIMMMEKKVEVQIFSETGREILQKPVIPIQRMNSLVTRRDKMKT